jgi:voltage-gated potassium channel Kch
MADDIIIVGGDALALSAARELCLIPGQRVVVLWPGSAEFAAAVAATGAVFVAGRPDGHDGLDAAGVMEAVSILALSQDEQLNLQAALRARDANPKIRIVLRQFNRTLAPKIEQNLPDCSVLSLAWHSAATYAAAALDPSCMRGLQFPEPDGPLTGFAVRLAAPAGVAGLTIAEAEAALGARIVALDGMTALDADEPIARQSRLIVFGPVAQLLQSAPRRPAPILRKPASRRLGRAARELGRRLRRSDPYVATLAAMALALFALASWYFRSSFHSSWLLASYFVLSTMTTVGYGDVTPHHTAGDMLAAMALMLLGVIFTGIFIAMVAARLTRAHWVRMQGLRPIRRRGHIIVCGCGSIGSGVIDLLLAFDKPLVVVEQAPETALVERARDRGFDLLTGDASRDATLDLCNLAAAHSLVALTNVDTLNLEIALGARARNPDMSIVLRIAEAAFASSIASHFQFETTFSVAALAGPVFAGLSRMPGARGRITFAGQDFAIGEIALHGTTAAALPHAAIPLAVAGGGGDCRLVRDFTGARPGSRALFLIPIAPFRDGSESVQEVIARIVAG